MAKRNHTCFNFRSKIKAQCRILYQDICCTKATARGRQRNPGPLPVMPGLVLLPSGLDLANGAPCPPLPPRPSNRRPGLDPGPSTAGPARTDLDRLDPGSLAGVTGNTGSGRSEPIARAPLLSARSSFPLSRVAAPAAYRGRRFHRRDGPYDTRPLARALLRMRRGPGCRAGRTPALSALPPPTPPFSRPGPPIVVPDLIRDPALPAQPAGASTGWTPDRRSAPSGVTSSSWPG